MAPKIDINTGLEPTSQLRSPKQPGDKSTSNFLKELEGKQANVIPGQTRQHPQKKSACQNFDSICSDLSQPTKVPPSSPLQLSHTKSIFAEENLLVLDLRCPVTETSETVIAYSNVQTTQLPLSEIVKILDFPIRVDVQNGTAKGWFIAENRNFNIDSSRQTMQVNGKAIPWDDEKISIGEGDIFIDKDLLSQLFPIDFNFFLSDMAAVIIPRERLPIEDLYSRKNDRLALNQQNGKEIKYQLQEDSYDLISFPLMDLSLSSGIAPGESNLYSNYSIIAEGDLGFMGTEAYFSGDTNTQFRTARITFNKTDTQSELLGPLKASQFSIGDVSPTGLPVLGDPGKEAGIVISNDAINRNNNFDTTRFDGNIQPGWDVEIYRNGDLIKSIKSGPEGRFTFEDIPLFFGQNSFKVIGYGPQGQQRLLEEKDIRVGSEMVAPEKATYSFSASQKNNSLLGLEENSNSDESARINGRLDYGINERITGSAGISSVEFKDTRHHYLQVGARGSFNSWYGQADYIFDTGGGSGISIQAQTQLLGQNLKIKQESFFDFTKESAPNKKLQDRSTVSVNGRVTKLPLFSHLSYTFNNRYVAYSDYETADFNTSLATTVGATNISNSTSWRYMGKEDSNLSGTFNISGEILGGNLRGAMKYALGNTNRIDEYRLGGTWELSPSLSAGGSLIKYNHNEQRDIYSSFNLSWDTGKVIFTPSITYDSKKGAGAFLGLTFSLGKDPVSNDILVRSNKITNKGSATAFVYHDQNNNQMYDANDKPIPDARIRVRQTNLSTTTNQLGTAQINSMSTFTPIDLELDEDSLQDPFWKPTIKGKAITPRPGVSKVVEIPVVTTGEIEGNIYAERNDDSQQVPLSGIGIEIYNDEGELIQTTKSEHDGFYLFQKVSPGEYTVKVRENALFRLNMTHEKKRVITIGNNGTLSSENNIILRPAVNNTFKEKNIELNKNSQRLKPKIEENQILIKPLKVQANNTYNHWIQSTSKRVLPPDSQLKNNDMRYTDTSNTHNPENINNTIDKKIHIQQGVADTQSHSIITISDLKVEEKNFSKNTILQDTNQKTNTTNKPGNHPNSMVQRVQSTSKVSIRSLNTVGNNALNNANTSNNSENNSKEEEKNTAELTINPLQLQQKAPEASQKPSTSIAINNLQIERNNTSKEYIFPDVVQNTKVLRKHSDTKINQRKPPIAERADNQLSQNKKSEATDSSQELSKISHATFSAQPFRPINMPIQPFTPIGTILANNQQEVAQRVGTIMYKHSDRSRIVKTYATIQRQNKQKIYL